MTEETQFLGFMYTKVVHWH